MPQCTRKVKMQVQRFYTFLLTATLLFSNLSVVFAKCEHTLCPCCTAQDNACAMSFSAPPCCEQCDLAASEVSPYDALQPEGKFQFLRALALFPELLTYPLISDSSFQNRVIEPCKSFSSQPPIYLRCEILLI